MRRLCDVPGCGETPARGNRCPAHTHQRRRAATRIYADQLLYKRKRWRLLRKRVLFEQPICEHCGLELAVDVDHIRPISKGADPYDRANLQALCKSCHAIKTRREMET